MFYRILEDPLGGSSAAVLCLRSRVKAIGELHKDTSDQEVEIIRTSEYSIDGDHNDEARDAGVHL